MNGWVSSQKEELRSDVLKLTLYELNSTISPREHRIKALRAAISEFNHNDPMKHDQELDLHADKIIFQKLAYCYAVRKHDEELGLLTRALEMLYRANRARVAISFHEVGESLLPLLVDMLRCSAARKKDLFTKLLEEQDTDDASSKKFVDDDSNTSFKKFTGIDGDLIAEQSSTSEFDNEGKQFANKNPKTKVHLSTVCEEKKEMRGDEFEETGDPFALEKVETSTACSSNGPDSPNPGSSSVSTSSSLPSSSSLPQKRQVRFSDMVSVDVSSNGEKVAEARIKLRTDEVTNPVAVKKVIKILRYFSRVLTAMIPMAHFPGLLDELVFNLRVPRGVEMDELLEEASGISGVSETSFHSAKTNQSMDSEYSDAKSYYSMDGSVQNGNARKAISDGIGNTARVDAIATIVNLACAEENKSKLLSHPGLLQAVVRVARDDPVKESREHASIVIMNLALEDSNKGKMATSDELIDTILKLLRDKSVNIRRYASSIMLSLACVAENTRQITRFCQGKALSQLAMVMVRDPVDEIRINVAECLFNCARYSTDAETIELMGQHKDVLPTLSQSVLSDYSADVRAYAARTLEWLAADIHYDSTCHLQLLDALAEASLWTKTNCIVEALKSQATIAENRKPLVEHEGILDALATLASLHGVNDSEVRECALVTIERLAHEPSTRKIMAAHEAIMTELTRATFSTTGLHDEYEEIDGESNYERSGQLMKSALKYLAEAL